MRRTNGPETTVPSPIPSTSNGQITPYHVAIEVVEDVADYGDSRSEVCGGGNMSPMIAECDQRSLSI
jgi:hypothetical protein